MTAISTIFDEEAAMRRTEEIETLRARYKRAADEHKWKTVAVIYVRLRYLMRQQLRAECRKPKPDADREERP